MKTVIMILVLLKLSAALKVQTIESDIKATTNFDTTGFDFQVTEGVFKPTIQMIYPESISEIWIIKRKRN